jgi:tetratricopeptide (TPR) repeat protein
MNRNYVGDQFIIIPALILFVVLADKLNLSHVLVGQVCLGLTILLVPSLLEQFAQTFLRARHFKAAELILRASVLYRSIAWLVPIKFLGRLYLVSLSQLADALKEQQKYPQSIATEEKLVRFAEMRFGTSAPETIECLINLAGIVSLAGLVDKSLAVGKKVSDLIESQGKVSQRQTENLCLALNNLGVIYTTAGMSDDAYALFDKSFHLKLDILGQDHPSISVAYQNLGYSLLTAEKYAAAEKYLKKALDRKGPGVEFAATANNNYGEACRGLGRLPEAEEYLQKAMDMRMKSLGKSHPHMGYSFHNLAKLYADKGDNEKANAFYERALELREKILPPTHPDLLRTMKDYAAFLRKTDRIAEAERLEKLVARHSKKAA